MDAQIKLAILFGSLVIGYLLGTYIGRAIRMKEYAWKLGVILGVVAFAAAVVGCYDRKFGIDLKGGVILIYEVDLQKTALNAAGSADGETDDAVANDAPKVNMNGLIQTLSRRINPSGVKEVVIRQFGENQVEIIIPDVDDAEIERIMGVISKTGFLKFRIVANAQHHAELRSLAESQKQDSDPTVRGASVVLDDAKEVIGEWVRVAKDLETSTPGNPQYKVDVAGAVTRELRPEQLEVLMAVDPDPSRHVNGTHLANVAIGIDEYASPCVNFKMNSRGASLFGRLTSKYSPENNIFSRLGIVMDGELISAPRIQTVITADGRITGRFTEEEVQELVNVLEAGHLPAVLKSEPISTNKIKALLGEDTIRKGKFAISLSLGLILVFMVGYYRFSGVIACLALATNLVLILALMTLISAAFTLPGLAGLVLTVGMSVDANVLIFERIREELNRGAALRMAIRNGFSKATTTIVDANVTTLITALVLYRIGTDQIRGFSVTLFLGILMSMFTAIFCSRAFFDIAERKRWITRLSMMQLLSNPSFNLIGKRGFAAVFSVLVLVVGCIGITIRGSNIFDIDFTGGTSVQAVFKERVNIETVRSLAGNLVSDDSSEQVQVSVYQVEVEQEEYKDRVYRIDTSLENIDDLETKLLSTFMGDDDTTLLETQRMTFDPPIAIASIDPASMNRAGILTSIFQSDFASDISLTKQLLDEARRNGQLLAFAQEETDESGEIPVDTSTPETSLDEPATNTLESNGAEGTPDENIDDDASESDESSETVTEESQAEPASNPIGGADSNDDPQETTSNSTDPLGLNADLDSASELEYQSKSHLEFSTQKVTKLVLDEQIEAASASLKITKPQVEITNPDWDGSGEPAFGAWDIKFTCDVQQSNEILEKIQSEFQSRPFLLSSSTIGGAVADKAKGMAIAALLTSLIGIVGYIWIRFQRVTYGFAAVIALLHDVAITVGAVALSYWLATVFGFLMVDEFKISLPVVAALLTIVGYSLNDTIVVFDRIREVKGKSPKLTEEMVNTSINQTLSRTILTSSTTLIVVLILYVFGGQGIHGFAFSLLVGVLVGTYSSIFIASPALLWMSQLGRQQPAPSQKVAA